MTERHAMWDYRIEDADRELRWFDRLLVAIALLAFLIGIVGWWSWVASNDERALRQLRAEQCKPHEVAFFQADIDHVLCLSGSQRVKAKLQ